MRPMRRPSKGSVSSWRSAFSRPAHSVAKPPRPWQNAGGSAGPRDARAGWRGGNNEFGFDLYRRLRSAPGNLVISPASLSIALTMAWGGAAGETAAQIGKVLHQ